MSKHKGNAMFRHPVPLKPSEVLQRRQPGPLSSPQLSSKEVRARMMHGAVVERLAGEGPSNAAAHVERDSEFEGSVMQLPVMSIKPYDKNPRRSLNTELESIKASIRERGGLTSLFRVTRRSPTEPYMVAEGGNSRLAALQALYQEGDERFEFVLVTYTTWRGDADAIAAHLIENETRGSMTFWDRANGVLDFKQELEAARGTTLSFRQLEVELRQHGLVVGLANLSSYKFGIERLSVIGPKLHIRGARMLQPHLNMLVRLGQRLGREEPDLWVQCFNPVLSDHAVRQGELDIERLCRDLSVSLGATLGHAREQVLRMLNWLERNPDANREQLEAIALHATTQARSRVNGSKTEAGGSAPGAENALEPSPIATNAPDATPDLGAEGVDLQGAQSVALDIGDMAMRLADLTGTRDCLKFDDGLPHGFYVEVPEQSIDTLPCPDVGLRYAGWWFLATLSQQADSEVAQHLPAGSRWRRTLLMEGGLDESAFAAMVEDDLLGVSGPNNRPFVDPAALLRLFSDSATQPFALALLSGCALPQRSPS